MPDVAALIDQYARRYRIDPRAARAVARTEGGLRWGAVGDQGTSYGPFQLHEGGALPRGRGASWANSPAGVEYAIRKMAEAGAAGLTGRSAIESIVRNFERPADPARSIARALGFYGDAPQAVSRPAMANTPVATTPEPVVPDGPQRTPRQAALLAGLLADDDPDLTSLLTERLTPKAPARAPSDKQVQRAGIVDPRGSVKPVRPANPIIAAAQTQLGKPYVFGSGPDTSSFDCSDLIQWAYKKAGIDLPRTTFDQINVGRDVRGQAYKPGDLIFPSRGHVVMYVGNGKVIAAPRTGTVVQYQPVSRFKNPVAVRRVL